MASLTQQKKMMLVETKRKLKLVFYVGPSPVTQTSAASGFWYYKTPARQNDYKQRYLT